MGLAMLYPEPEKGGRGQKKKGGETPGFSAKRLHDARKVLAFSRELAEAVRDGKTSLDRDGFTMEQIGTQLGVSKATIARDLGELSHDETIKPTAKTATNPKGAGRLPRKGA